MAKHSKAKQPSPKHASGGNKGKTFSVAAPAVRSDKFTTREIRKAVREVLSTQERQSKR
jgi:hypothetical protein